MSPLLLVLVMMLVLVGPLGGCATPQRQVGDAPWISGRMAVRVAASPEHIARSFSASFDLRGTGEQGELRLSTTLGTRLATATWAPGLALLRTSEGEQRYADLDELSRQALGEALPLVALADWLAGRPWPGALSQPTQRGASNFEQLGWQVDLSRMKDGAVALERATAPAVEVRVRLDDPS